MDGEGFRKDSCRRFIGVVSSRDFTFQYDHTFHERFG